MNVNPGIFREYDIRGLIGKDLNEESIEAIGKGYATFLLNKNVKKVSIGGDGRITTPLYVDILCKVVSESGLDVIKLTGPIPSPVSYFSLFQLDIGASIMVTASHNAKEYNGLKLGLGKTTIHGKEIQEVLKLIQSDDFTVAKEVGEISEYNLLADYVEYLKSKFSFSRKLKIAVDAGNGTAGIFVPKLLKALGQDVIELFCEVDGNFPNHHPDPTVEKNLTDLKKAVADGKCDFGVGYDGDSDRIGIVDNKGRVIWGDNLLLIYAMSILKQGKGKNIVYEVKCTRALDDVITAAGGNAFMWKTGHSLLKAKMKEVKADIAGEMSGHMFFADRYFGYDDAVYATLRLIEILIEENEPLSAIRDRYPWYCSTPEIRVDLDTDEEKFKIVDIVSKYFKANYKTIDIDGIRILFENGFGLVRASNTQPSLVLRFEADTEENLKKYRDIVESKIKENGNFTIV